MCFWQRSFCLSKKAGHIPAGAGRLQAWASRADFLLLLYRYCCCSICQRKETRSLEGRKEWWQSACGPERSPNEGFYLGRSFWSAIINQRSKRCWARYFNLSHKFAEDGQVWARSREGLSFLKYKLPSFFIRSADDLWRPVSKLQPGRLGSGMPQLGSCCLVSREAVFLGTKWWPT